MTKRAYICTSEASGEGGIVFAATNLAARKIAADEWNDGELSGLSVRHEKGLDQYAETGRVPAAVLVNGYGWRYDECCYCGAMLDADLMDDEGKDPAKIVGFDGGRVYCDQTCADAETAMRLEQEAAGQAVIDALVSRLRSRFGDQIEIGRTHHYTRRVEGLCTTEQAFVEFSFPGQNYGPAALRFENARTFGCTRVMPPDLFFTVPNGDHDAWRHWTKGLSNA